MDFLVRRNSFLSHLIRLKWLFFLFNETKFRSLTIIVPKMKDYLKKLFSFPSLPYHKMVYTIVIVSRFLSFLENSPPTILVRLPNGSSAVDLSNNQVVIYPNSIVHLECLFKRSDGDPEWSWSSGQQHRLTGKYLSIDPSASVSNN